MGRGEFRAAAVVAAVMAALAALVAWTHHLPVRDPDGLADVRISGGNRGFGVNPGRYPELTAPVWEDIQKHQQAFSEMFAWKTRDLRVGERNDLKRAYDERFGIGGGLSDRERRKLKKRAV